MATCRSGTPLKAAEALGCAPSSVYRAIDRLERELGTPLFIRNPAGWTPTETGKRILWLAERVEQDVLTTELQLLGRSKRYPSPLRISASDAFASSYLGPVLAELVRITPDLEVELITDNQFADLARREADVAIRPDTEPGDGLIGRRAGKLQHGLYVSTAMLRKIEAPASLAEVARFPLCLLSPRLAHFTSASWHQRAELRQEPHIAFVANTETALATAIAAGAGIGVLPRFLGDRLSGVERIPFAVSEPVDIWIVTHATLRDNAIVRTALRALAGAIRRDAGLFSGGRR